MLTDVYLCRNDWQYQWCNDMSEQRKKQLDLDTLEEIHLLSPQIGILRHIQFFMYYQIHIHEAQHVHYIFYNCYPQSVTDVFFYSMDLERIKWPS